MRKARQGAAALGKIFHVRATYDIKCTNSLIGMELAAWDLANGPYLLLTFCSVGGEGAENNTTEAATHQM